MLIGCCHCGEELSESIPPSESTPPSESDSESASDSDSESGSSASESDVAALCMPVCGGVFPRRYRLDVVDSGVFFPSRTCCAGSFGSFTMHYTSYGALHDPRFNGILPNDSECLIVYESEERAFLTGCVADPDEPRFIMALKQDASPGPVAGIRVAVISRHGQVSAPFYTQAWTRFYTYAAFPCLGTLTVNGLASMGGGVVGISNGTCWGYKNAFGGESFRTLSVTAVPL